MNRKKSIEFLIHLVFWIIVFYFFTNNSYLRFHSRNSKEEYYSLALVLTMIYLNYFILIPRFFNNQKHLKYFGFLFLTLLTITVIEFVMLKDDILLYTSSAGDIQKTFLVWNFSYIMFRDLLFVGFFTMFQIYRNAIQALKLLNEKANLEKINYENRIEMVKSSINSHFLYNCMNVICSLANRKSDKTLEVTQNLVGLMEYVVTDTEFKWVPLDKEINFLKNYIALESIRHRSVNLEFDISGETSLHKVPPMIFESYINNAFKYTDINNNGYIRIKLECKPNAILFLCENQMCKFGENEVVSTGKGLNNTFKRLELHYKEKYDLKIENDNNAFKVSLLLITN